MLLVAPLSAHAGNIFDEDWTPPARPSIPQPEGERKQPVTVPTPMPADPVPAPTPVPAVPGNLTTPRVARLPIPATADLAKVRPLFKEAFARQMSDRAPAARRAFATQLLEAAAKATDAPVDRFVLLTGARQAAVEAIDLSLTLKSIDALGSAFAVDEMKLKLDCALKAGGKADTMAATFANVRAGLRLLDDLVAAGDYTGASRLASSLSIAATSDPMFTLVVQQRAREIEPIRSAFDRIARDIEKLKTSPEDAPVNSAVGAFLCYLKGDWDRGLPLLAKGSDPSGKRLAEIELKKPTQADSLIQLADGWWDLAEKETEHRRLKIRQHAAGIYKRTLNDAVGLRKASIEKRISDSVGPNRLIDLLALADSAQHGVSGDWSLSDAGLRVGSNGTRLEFPYAAPEEYWYRIEFTTQGECTVYQGLAKAGQSFRWVMGNLNNTWIGFERIADKDTSQNRTGVKAKPCLQIGRVYTSLVEIRNGYMRAFLDGKVVAEWKTDYHDMSPGTGSWFPRDIKLLAVGTWNAPTVFQHVEVLDLTTAGKSDR
jgi:hypothetical protein